MKNPTYCGCLFSLYAYDFCYDSLVPESPKTYNYKIKSLIKLDLIQGEALARIIRCTVGRGRPKMITEALAANLYKRKMISLRDCRISPLYPVLYSKIAEYLIYFAIMSYYKTTFRKSTFNVLQETIMNSYIDNYIGEWENEAGNRLKIKKVDDETAMVYFFAPPDHQPINRPWYDEKPSIDMIAKYRPAEGPGLVVELWEE